MAFKLPALQGKKHVCGARRTGKVKEGELTDCREEGGEVGGRGGGGGRKQGDEVVGVREGKTTSSCSGYL